MLRAILKKLLKPLIYLKIKHEQKRFIDFYVPSLIGAIALLLIDISPVPINIIGQGSLVAHVNGLLQMLIGFFVASLAAVATFQRDGMDEVMQGEAPLLNDEEVTRRQYICYMFGYLAFVSLGVYFVTGIVDLSLGAWAIIFGTWYTIVKWFALYLYLVVVANIFITTLLALHFLTDRIVRTDYIEPEE